MGGVPYLPENGRKGPQGHFSHPSPWQKIGHFGYQKFCLDQYNPDIDRKSKFYSNFMRKVKYSNFHISYLIKS